MTDAPLAESPRPAFRWWGERVRIVIGRRPPRIGKRPAETPEPPVAIQAREAAA